MEPEIITKRMVGECSLSVTDSKGTRISPEVFSKCAFAISGSGSGSDSLISRILLRICSLIDLLLDKFTFDIPLIRSATSIRQLGHHVVSTVVCHLLHPDCCCIRVEMVDQGLS